DLWMSLEDLKLAILPTRFNRINEEIKRAFDNPNRPKSNLPEPSPSQKLWDAAQALKPMVTEVKIVTVDQEKNGKLIKVHYVYATYAKPSKPGPPTPPITASVEQAALKEQQQRKAPETQRRLNLLNEEIKNAPRETATDKLAELVNRRQFFNVSAKITIYLLECIFSWDASEETVNITLADLGLLNAAPHYDEINDLLSRVLEGSPSQLDTSNPNLRKLRNVALRLSPNIVKASIQNE